MLNTAEALRFEDLQELTGYTRPADIERCLKKQGIGVFWGRKGPWTTMALINAAGGLTDEAATQSDNDDVEFEDETR